MGLGNPAENAMLAALRPGGLRACPGPLGLKASALASAGYLHPVLDRAPLTRREQPVTSQHTPEPIAIHLPHSAYAPRMLPDPLDLDLAGDEVRLVSDRQLQRIALVAMETACRYQREDRSDDPMAWMLAPRRLFDGRPALHACGDRRAFRHALILHGLALGMDGDPDAYDDLVDDETCCRTEDPWLIGPGHARLFTASLAVGDAASRLHCFHAAVAASGAAVMADLEARLGDAARHAAIRTGFDPSEPIAASLLSEALADLLGQVAADPTSPLAAGLAIHLEQRFDA